MPIMTLSSNKPRVRIGSRHLIGESEGVRVGPDDLDNFNRVAFGILVNRPYLDRPPEIGAVLAALNWDPKGGAQVASVVTGFMGCGLAVFGVMGFVVVTSKGFVE